ncbi:putative serine/threonine-protein kinase PIX13 [Heracleum sosnowskyi]|uniref:Serine/threonine-protein kinase PIX13 n=1 Tax=Heracleum sosnowskyi TaxID=360622 RepID=A0AAD8GQ64_9APIA|nr:putative serine/threonine-protein kinase PIX13 [Heracleum sosnowskyi]
MGNFFRSPSRGSSTTTRLPTESVYNARNQESSNTTSSWDDVQVEATPTLKIYSSAQLKKATGNFRPGSMLGNGFGKVYRGWVNKETLAPSKTGVGIPVAVRQSNPGQSLEQWQAEVEFLGKFSHRNIVKLLGYCRDDKQFLLVYEYMHKGSLENHLFRKLLQMMVQENFHKKIAVKDPRTLHTTFGLADLHNITRVPENTSKLSNINHGVVVPRNTQEARNIKHGVVGGSGTSYLFQVPQGWPLGKRSIRLFNFWEVILRVLVSSVAGQDIEERYAVQAYEGTALAVSH